MSAEFEPTTNVQIEPESVIDLEQEAELTLPMSGETPPPEPVQAVPLKPQKADCCVKKEIGVETGPMADTPYNPLLLLQALGLAFSAGALIGIGVAYAFSRPTVLEYVSE